MRGGNKTLKRVFYQSAFASLRGCAQSRAFYDRKRAEGKRHTQALVALARRRVNVLWAMLRDLWHYTAYHLADIADNVENAEVVKLEDKGVEKKRRPSRDVHPAALALDGGQDVLDSADVQERFLLPGDALVAFMKEFERTHR